MRARAAVGAGAVAAAAAAVLLVGRPGEERSGPPAARAATAGATASVTRKDLVDRETVAGTLGSADGGTLAAGVAGTLTRLRAEGTVVRQGGWTYEVDGRPTGWLLHGRRPAWRDFVPGMARGADVRQLEHNLARLGHDPGVVDGTWTAATTAAVKRFQAARGMTQDGTLSRGELVFRRGAIRMGEARAAIGDQVGGGRPVAQLGSLRREVTVDLRADRQQVARRGARVTVTLPDGRTARGRVTSLAKVAREGQGENDPATVTVKVALLGRDGRRGGLDQAPVDVGFERERSEGVLVVPVAALLARPGGGYAVETPDGRLVAVEVGLHADGEVEVGGAGVREGMKVVVAR